jgi:hypothetical protein
MDGAAALRQHERMAVHEHQILEGLGTAASDGPLVLGYDGSEDAKYAIERAAGLLGSVG